MQTNKAWLIYWDWLGASRAVTRNILDILPPQRSPRRVADYLVALYINSEQLIPSERLRAYRNRDLICPVRFEGPRVMCGDNPSLVANKVTDLSFSSDPQTGDEIVEWTSVPGLGVGPDPMNPPRMGEPVPMMVRFSTAGIRIE